MTRARAFPALDAMRGTAAIAVLQFHTPQFFGVFLFPHGFLAVDFFFMLSGFVLSFAYQDRIDRGGFTWEFFKVRFARLYPLYFAGWLLGLALLVAQVHQQPNIATHRGLVLTGLCGLLLLPIPSAVAIKNITAFPLNSASWSLFGEAVANILHVVLLKRRSTLSLCILATLLFVPVCFFAHRTGALAFGWQRSDIYVGLVRVMFSYVLGMILYRLHESGNVTLSLPPALSCLLLLGLFAVPNRPSIQVAMDLVMVTTLFPLLLITGVRAMPSRGFAGLANLLGQASYALYILHKPLEDTFDHVWVRLRGMPTERDAPWPGIVFFVLVMLIAIGMDSFYDTPARRWLSEHLLRCSATDRAQKKVATHE